jgi:hypothetical protein
MTTGLKQISQSEFVRRAIERTGQNSWLALLVPDGRLASVVEQVAAGIAAEAEIDVFRVDAPKDAEALARAGRRAGVVVASLGDAWPPEEWSRLDALRSRLQREHRTVLVLSESAATRIFREAPHFARNFTGSVWDLASEPDEMSGAERLDRVASLERWAKLSTPEMLTRAETRTLPPDPEYAEWLVLVGRSDLL